MHLILIASFFISTKCLHFQNSTWTFGENFPPNIPLGTLQQLNGAKEEPNLYEDIELKLHNITRDIPENFDSRDVWPNCQSIKEIRNQGFCGSCWAFGAVEAMTDRFCIASNATNHFQFSPENLLACCQDCGNGCRGGYSSRAWTYWVNNGIVSGGDYKTEQGCQPYTKQAYENSTTPECQMTCSNGNYTKSYENDKKYGLANYRIAQDPQQIQYEIMMSGPVQASYAVYNDFYHYKSGVYQHITGDKSGYHSVKIIGWGIENETPYWLIANSWGPKWGDLGGFFKMKRGENHCGIEEHILGGEPKL